MLREEELRKRTQELMAERSAENKIQNTVLANCLEHTLDSARHLEEDTAQIVSEPSSFQERQENLSTEVTGLRSSRRIHGVSHTRNFGGISNS